ncbi:hypothetical protein ACPXCP_40020 [Streptomyces sp. DT20]|uniref:hypothetical protein n=1 Tax=Streptomyces sp. DT20 TaxID=3416519 RepID=UPI003CF1C340
MGVLLHAPSSADDEAAVKLLMALIEEAGNGLHHLALSVTGMGGVAFEDFSFMQEHEKIASVKEEGLAFCRLLAVAVSGAHPSGLAMRSVQEGVEGVCAWIVRNGQLRPLSRAEAFNAYCHNPDSGEITPPEPGVQYNDAPFIHL